MFVKSNSRREIYNNYFFNNKSLPKGNIFERLVFLISRLLDNPKGKLAYKNNYDMSNVKNFVSEISVSYSHTYKRKIKITGVESAEKTLRKMWDTQLMNIQEQFCVLFLNNANEVIGFRCLSSGTLIATLVDFKMLFGLACKSLSSAIIIAHNHPSGKLKPSKADLDLTQKVKRAGNMLDIELLDHIILTQNSYTSLVSEHYI